MGVAKGAKPSRGCIGTTRRGDTERSDSLEHVLEKAYHNVIHCITMCYMGL